MCFAEGEFRLGGRDVHLGDVAGAPFYIDGRQFERWAHTSSSSTWRGEPEGFSSPRRRAFHPPLEGLRAR